MRDDLTPRQVAAELGVSVRTVQRWIADGSLGATRIGSRVRVSRSSLATVRGGSPAPSSPIRSLLVANRGEIARRVARTARAMGIRVIGVHAPDERPPDGFDDVREIRTFLDADGLIAIARSAAVDAVHPGYGFLAENAAFAAAVADAGLRWVGPPASAIAAMGDKAEARHRAAANGVPTIPGYDGPAQDDPTLAAEAARIGFPILVKPSAGGGGKGMRAVARADDLPEALESARREAGRSFGDERLILERQLAGARHVEVQVLFDEHGSGIHLGERDCSVQRRNQKIIEEAPGPSMTAELRARMGAAAVRVAAAVRYASAGTVEMLLTDAGEFFFLEMNTRLQVEHPVTEAVTGRDLVADQLHIASGMALTDLGLHEPPMFRGHAIEARVYAEDPESGFLPATGRLALVRWPPGVRVDAGIEEGDLVSDRYDPMLAKLIASAPTRAEALESLQAALDATTVLGVRTNLRFLRWLVRQPAIAAGEMRTNTIESLDLPPMPELSDEHWQAAALLFDDPDAGPWGGSWRLNAGPIRRVRHADAERAVPPPGPGWTGPSAVREAEIAHVDVDGQSLEFRVAAAPTVDEAVRHATEAGAEGIASLVAPMPGRVIRVRAREHASVQAHQPVIVIEAMKMEHAVVAPFDGILSRLLVEEGQQVRRGDLLAEVAEEPDRHTGDLP